MPTKIISKLTPTNLRMILMLSILVIFVGGGGAFWFFREQLVTLSQQVKTKSTEAKAGQNDIERLQNIKKELDNSDVSVKRTKKIVADSKFYQYQDQVISDVSKYALDSGITIGLINFSSQNTTTPLTKDLTAPQAVTPKGLKSIDVSVSIKGAVNYESIMRFIRAIEVNLTKMQLAGVSLRMDASTGAISSGPMTIRIYTR